MTNLERAAGRMNQRKAAPASDEILHTLAASANRIDMIIAVFAIGVLFGMWIA